MSTACHFVHEDRRGHFKVLRPVRCLLVALAMTSLSGLQGCTILTVMAVTEALSAVNDSLQQTQAELPASTATPVPEPQSLQTAARPSVREVRYRTRLDREAIQAGMPVQLYSSLSLDPRNVIGSTPIEETLTVFDPKGREIRRGSKKAGALGDGNFRSRFELLLPTEAPEGIYRLVTEAYFGAQLIARHESTLKLTRTGRERQNNRQL